jgi:phosphodiesterase/alkaline phosphatase D-like protein
MKKKAFLVLVPVSIICWFSMSFMLMKNQNHIVFTLYTVHDGVMKMTAQMSPLRGRDIERVRLEVKKGGEWVQIAETDIVTPGWTAHFRVENWDSSNDVPYRVLYGKDSSWEGVIRKDPVEKDVIVVAAFTGNGPRPRVPKSDIVENLKKYDPDLLVFTGDQVYRHYNHLEEWIKFGRDFGELIKDRPTICIPDDHDVAQGNLWGAGGKKAKKATDGGYLRDPEYINEVQRAQTSHLPDPYDPAPVEQGIGVYYTALTWGGINFAIIEDRKFKSGCAGLVAKDLGPRPDHITINGYDKDALDVQGATLLGERQLEFLREWAADWKDAEMKAVISQTVLCNVTNYHSRFKLFVRADLDSNGWPRTGRNKALREIRKGFAFMINGDQHLASIVHHGIDDWNDSGCSFCVPSIANYWPRWWLPEEPGKNREPGAPENTGEFEDGFDNKITVLAVANPGKTGREPAVLHDKAPGYGIIKFNKKDRAITMECWPRQVDPADPANQNMQYEGWPRTISQEDNYGRKAFAFLPQIEVKGMEDPVVQIINEKDNEIIYTLRIKGAGFRAKVFEEGKYTIKVGELHTDKVKIINGVKSLSEEKTQVITIDLSR